MLFTGIRGTMPGAPADGDTGFFVVLVILGSPRVAQAGAIFLVFDVGKGGSWPIGVHMAYKRGLVFSASSRTS